MLILSQFADVSVEDILVLLQCFTQMPFGDGRNLCQHLLGLLQKVVLQLLANLGQFVANSLADLFCPLWGRGGNLLDDGMSRIGNALLKNLCSVGHQGVGLNEALDFAITVGEIAREKEEHQRADSESQAIRTVQFRLERVELLLRRIQAINSRSHGRFFQDD